MHTADQPAPTPRTDSCIGTDKFIPAWKVRKEMGQLERELSTKTAEADRLREAASDLVSLWDSATETEESMEAAVRKLALAATRKECEHGKGLTDYCQPCGRVNNG